jgi:MFS family permease
MQGFDDFSQSRAEIWCNGKWYGELNRYHWFVLIVAALGWLFDTMDQQLFTLARKPAIAELLGVSPSDPRVDEYGAYTTAIFIIGWATGGLFFGVLGDRYGRARTMLLTILVYSLFTGLSAWSFTVWDFSLYRFLTGLGVGGEFAVGLALVAEVMPERARTQAIGLLQALSAVGNVTAALISIGLGTLQQRGMLPEAWSAWRIMFVIGALPALLAVVIRARLKEPERWKAAVASGSSGQKLGSFRELFGDPRWRRNALVGLALAFAGVVGLWGIGFFSPDLVSGVFRKTFEAQGLSDDEVGGKLQVWVGINSMLLNIGAFFGIYSFSWISQRTGRKPAFAVAFLLAMVSTAYTFWFLRDFSDIFWMTPIMGFCQLSLFGGYAVYFPELFPTRLRSTGISFCYNVGRFVAAAGPFTLGLLIRGVFQDFPEPMRYAGVSMCVIFLLGLLAVPFAVETKGKPLPE